MIINFTSVQMVCKGRGCGKNVHLLKLKIMYPPNTIKSNTSNLFIKTINFQKVFTCTCNVPWASKKILVGLRNALGQ